MGEHKGSWGKTQEAMEDQGNSLFLRLENDGDKAVIALCGAPFHRDICFNEKTKSYEPYDDAAKAAGRKKTSRYAMNAYCISLNGKAVNDMKIVDANFNTMQQIIALKDKYGLGKYLFEIVRNGAKGDTKTTYQLLPDKEITDEMRAIFGKPDPKNEDGWIDGTTGLLDLEEVTARGEDDSTQVSEDVKNDGKKGKKEKKEEKKETAPAAPPPATPPASNGTANSSATISKEVAAELIEKLKPLDRDKGINPFLARFPYAKKVSEVKASDESAARALVNELAGIKSPEAADDPFG